MCEYVDINKDLKSLTIDPFMKKLIECHIAREKKHLIEIQNDPFYILMKKQEAGEDPPEGYTSWGIYWKTR